MGNIGYYIFVLVALMVAFIVVKKVASCMIKSVVPDRGFGCDLLPVFHVVAAVSSANRRSKASRSLAGFSMMARSSLSLVALGELGIHRRR